MQSINLQIAPGSVNPVINVSQNDVGRQFQLKLYDGAAAYTLPTGTTASIEGIKPDGHAFSYSDAVSVSGSILTVTTKLQMTVVAGRVICEIRLRKSGLDLGSLNFVMLVEESPINENVDPSDTEIPAIIELAEEQVEDAEAWARGTKNGEPVPSTAPQFQNNAQWYAEHVAASLDALSNVNISSPVNEDVLDYNSTTQKWKNSGAVRQLKQALSDEAETRATLGAHNLRYAPFEVNRSVGLTVTNNADTSITISGTHTATGGTTIIQSYQKTPQAGNYIISMGEQLPANVVLGVLLFTQDQSSYVIKVNAASVENATFSISESEASSYPLIRMAINVPYGVSWGITKTYYPMLCLASDIYPTYQAGAMTNRELTDEVAFDSVDITSFADDYAAVNFKLFKKGGVIYSMMGELTVPALNYNTYAAIAYIPDGFKVRQQLYAEIAILNDTTHKMLLFLYPTDNKIYIKALTGIPAGTYYVHVIGPVGII